MVGGSILAVAGYELPVIKNMYFKFKQFTVRHDRCAMKVGTDGVLLGAWSDVGGAERVLDIGTGTGLVALMIAQRSSARIIALDIDADAVLEARENAACSPWSDRIEVLQHDFRTYTSPVKFDCIVSNPPYFTNSLKCPVQQRTLARHDLGLTYSDLLQGVSRLLTNDGRFFLVIPTDASTVVQQSAESFGLYPFKQLNVVTAPGKLPKRTLMAFSPAFHPEYPIEEIVLEQQRHVYSAEYMELTREYYLGK